MTVIVANDVPAFIRGHLKRWFIEPRPNVFVGTLNVRTHDKVMQFIVKHAPPDFGFLSITSWPNCQGYKMERFGPQGASGQQELELSGISLIEELSNKSK
ncbi:type I-E CRISPR-associated endoribonuclease Cas2e [Coraliomargarita algicola]|uniref:Type I-E CRISPR-associated endoribonuclease Cas2e n=1 Tax=Coraliomargarita algicola TaxID=3092156 RepID=A0ABZ0RJS5_9BACT|nr:type I-E CRISPR-associated endoribonuclease Cas2e [Coraliomargarita sp. J2-16]WPJ95656.1 type I-E CRISPR-associated endoribonuclease Cas2e [Coraliomargarita sp. J2-16]